LFGLPYILNVLNNINGLGSIWQCCVINYIFVYAETLLVTAL